MMGEITVFEVMKTILLWTSPVMFMLGIMLVLYTNYKRLEEFFGKEIFGVKHKVVPLFETNIYNFHEWLLERRTLVGLICVIFSIAIFFIYKK
jgi:hypothetical protein